MTDELREKARVVFTDWHCGKGEQSLPNLLAEFAVECFEAERERADRLQQECDDVYERLSWILAACTIDRDTKNEIEAMLKRI